MMLRVRVSGHTFSVPYFNRLNLGAYRRWALRALRRGEADLGVVYAHGASSKQAWDEIKKGGDPCADTLRELLQTDAWRSLQARHPIDTFVDLGAGTGDKLRMLVEDRLLHSTSDVRAIAQDINKSMLREAAKNLIRLGDRVRIATVRAEFRKLTDVLGLVAAEAPSTTDGAAAFLLLGGTFSNFAPEVPINLLKRNARPGDFVIISTGVLSIGEDRQSLDDMFKGYSEKEYNSLFDTTVSNMFPTIEKPVWHLRSRMNDDQTFAGLFLIAEIEGVDVEVVQIGRHPEEAVVSKMSDAGFKHYLSFSVNRSRFYRYMIFERTA